MRKIYITDLDGTLLRPDGFLSDYARNKLNSLIEEGICFTVASARSVVTMREAVGDLRLKLPVICYNGVFTSDLETGRHLIINAMDDAMLEPIIELSHKHGCEAMVSTVSNGADHLFYSSAHNEAMQSYVSGRIAANDFRMRYIENITEAFSERTVSFVYVDRFERLDALSREITGLPDNHVEINFFENVYMPGWYWMTVHSSRASKDQAIRRLLDDYGLTKHELVVFGDNLNDIKMFKLASHAVAVENAVPELKHYASEIIGSNHSDSVVDYIEQDFDRQDQGE